MFLVQLAMLHVAKTAASGPEASLVYRVLRDIPKSVIVVSMLMNV